MDDFDFSDVLPLCEDTEMKKTEDYIEDVMIDSDLVQDMYKVIAECLNTNESTISIEKAEFVTAGGKCSKDYYLVSGIYWDGEEKQFNKLRYYPAKDYEEKDLCGDVLIK